MPSTLVAVADGNLTGAATHAVCDPTSALDSELNTTAISTSNLDSAASTPGVITVSGVMVKLSARAASPTGTFTVTLRNSTAGSDVTSVTVNVSDLNANASGWVYFKFGVAQLLLAATNYLIRVVCSNTGSQVTLFRNATAANWSRQLVTTTTAAPGTGDTILLAGEHTGAGASATRTITMDSDGTTTYAGVAISDKGVLTWARTGSITRTLKLSGYTVDATKYGVRVLGGGTYDMGTTASPIPFSSTATLQLVVGANVDFGIECPSGTFNAAGDPAFRTGYRGFLASDAAAAATALTLDGSYGWKNGDEIAVPSTSRTASQCERRTLTGDAVTTGITVAALTNAHSGTNSGGYDTRAMVILLTRNVKILGVSYLLGSYINFGANGTGTLGYVEIRWMGSGTANKRGIDTSSTVGVTITHCGIYEFGVSSTQQDSTVNCVGFNATGATTAPTFQSNNCAFIRSSIVAIPVTSATPVVDANWIVYSIGTAITSSDAGTTFTNNRVAGSNSIGISVNEAAALGSFSGNVTHSNGANGFSFTNLIDGTASNCTTWRCVNAIILVSVRGTLVLDGWKEWDANGSTFSVTSYTGELYVTNGVFGPLSGSGFSTTNLLTTVTANRLIIFENCSFGQSSNYSNLVSPNSVGQLLQAQLRYCSIGGSPADVVAPSTNLGYGSYVGFSYYGQANVHRKYFRNGLREFISGGGAKLTPSVAYSTNADLVGSGPMETQVTSGQQVSFTVHAQKSASYNGPQPTVWLLANGGMGIASDTLLATAVSANGVDEGVAFTYTPSADGIVELEVRAAGTVGNVQVTRFTASGGYAVVGDAERFLRGNPQSVLA